MARRRFRPGRILAVCVLFLLLCLLLELNRFLPGGWPGGGGDGGLREAETLDLRDVPGTPGADQPTPLVLQEPEGRPPVSVPREGVLIEVRAPAGTYHESWRFGLGDGGPSDTVRKADHGRHASKDKRILGDGFRLEVGGGALRLHTGPLAAEPGHWIVVVPDDLGGLGRRQSGRLALTPGTEGPRRLVAQGVDGTPVPIDTDDGTPHLSRPRRPVHVTAKLRPTDKRPWIGPEVAPGIWVGPRTVGPVTVEASPTPLQQAYHDARRDRLVQGTGAAQVVVRYAVAVGAGNEEPGYVEVRADAGTGSVQVPKGVALDILLDDGRTLPTVHRFEPGAKPARPAHERRAGTRRTLRILDAGGAPVAGARVLVPLPAAPFQALREGTTDADGRVRLEGLPDGALAVFVRAPGLATTRVLLDGTEPAGHELRLAAGLPLRVVVTNAEGLPIPGATVDVEPEGQGAPLPVLPTPPGTDPAFDGTRTDRSGTWRQDGLPIARYVVRVHAPGYRRETVKAVLPGQARTYFVTLLRP